MAPSGNIGEGGAFMKTISLWEIEDLFGMIVRVPSGLKWSNQTGGVLCSHPVLEGVFVPLPQSWFLVNSIENEMGYIKSDGDLKAHNRRLVGRFLEANPEIQKRFEFDESFNESAAEAWVPLKVMTPDDEILKPFHGLPVVITYENSD
jgi:hypothetical protein